MTRCGIQFHPAPVYWRQAVVCGWQGQECHVPLPDDRQRCVLEINHYGDHKAQLPKETP